MPITLEVPDEIVETAARLAERAGTSTEKLLLDALRIQLGEDSEAELWAEIRMWERASEEDIARFEQREGIS